MTEKNVVPELFPGPFIKYALDMAMVATISVARIAQIAVQSTDIGLAKYIELAEKEVNGSRSKESVKVD